MDVRVAHRPVTPRGLVINTVALQPTTHLILHHTPDQADSYIGFIGYRGGVEIGEQETFC